MTREEEIEQAWFLKACLSTHCYDEKSFKEATEWADKTMIEKACKWLTKHLYDYDQVEGYEVFRDVNSFVNDFRKAMEE